MLWKIECKWVVCRCVHFLLAKCLLQIYLSELKEKEELQESTRRACTLSKPLRRKKELLECMRGKCRILNWHEHRYVSVSLYDGRIFHQFVSRIAAPSYLHNHEAWRLHLAFWKIFRVTGFFFSFEVLSLGSSSLFSERKVSPQVFWRRQRSQLWLEVSLQLWEHQLN